MAPKDEALFGARLRKLRLERGFSQRDLAEPLYTAAYISTVEAGKRRPSRPALEHFAQRLGVELDQLLTGKPPGLEARFEIQLNDARSSISAGRLDRALKTIELVRREAKRFQLRRYEARAIEARAMCYEHQGDFDAAFELYESVCERLAEEPATTRTAATTGVARLAHMAGNSHYAIHLLERFLVELIGSNLPDPQSMMSVHASLVLSYFDVGVRDHAALHAEEALKLASDSYDPYALATMNIQVARVMLESGQVKDAEISLGKAEDLFRQIDMRSELAMARLAHGYALARSGRDDEAEKLLRSALATFEEVGRTLDRARAANELGRMYRRQNRGEEAEEMLERSLELLEGSDPKELARTHKELALCIGISDAKKAEKNLVRAIELFDLAEDKVERAEAYGLLGDLMRVTGRTKDACESYRTGIAQFIAGGDGFGGA